MDTTNRFPQLVEMAVQLVPIEPSWDEPSSNEVDAYLTANRHAIDTIRELLQQPCQNQLPADGAAWRISFNKIPCVRELARIFRHSSQALERHGDLSGAVEEANNCLKLALAVRTESLMTDYLISVAIERRLRLGRQLPRLRRLRRCRSG